MVLGNPSQRRASFPGAPREKAAILSGIINDNWRGNARRDNETRGLYPRIHGAVFQRRLPGEESRRGFFKTSGALISVASVFDGGAAEREAGENAFVRVERKSRAVSRSSRCCYPRCSPLKRSPGSNRELPARLINLSHGSVAVSKLQRRRVHRAAFASY